MSTEENSRIVDLVTLYYKNNDGLRLDGGMIKDRLSYTLTVVGRFKPPPRIA